MKRYVAALSMGALLATMAPLAALAQSVIGKSAVDGRVIELLSDRTWRYADEASTAPGGCQQLQLGVSFCGKSHGWTEIDPQNPEIAAQYFYDDRNYGQYVIEAIGSDDGISPAFYREIVITNAASAAGIPEKDVVILGVEPVELAGQTAETIIYQVAIDGLEVVFINTVAILPKKSLQALTFSVGKVLTPEHQDLHRQFLEHTNIE